MKSLIILIFDQKSNKMAFQLLKDVAAFYPVVIYKDGMYNCGAASLLSINGSVLIFNG